MLQPVGVVGEVVQRGVLGVGHAGAGAPLRDDLLGREQQLVQERDDFASHKRSCLPYRPRRSTAGRPIGVIFLDREVSAALDLVL